MMNIEFENRIEIIPLEDLSQISGSNVLPLDGRSLDLLLTENDINLTDEPQEENGNPFYQQTLKAVIQKLPGNLAQKYRNNRPVIVQLHRSDGTPLVWGDPFSPVRVVSTPYPGHDLLQLTRNALNPVL